MGRQGFKGHRGCFFESFLPFDLWDDVHDIQTLCDEEGGIERQESQPFSSRKNPSRLRENEEENEAGEEEKEGREEFAALD